MKAIFQLRILVMPALAAACFAAPAFSQDAQHDHQHQAPATPTPANKESARSTKAPGSTGMAAAGKEDMMDMQAMCDMHKQMMSAKTEKERQAMAQERMKGMSPQMKQEKMRMMEKQCK